MVCATGRRCRYVQVRLRQAGPSGLLSKWLCPSGGTWLMGGTWQENGHKPKAERANSTVAAFPFIPGCSRSPSFLIWGVGAEVQSLQAGSHGAALLLPVSAGLCIRKGGAAGRGAEFWTGK